MKITGDLLRFATTATEMVFVALLAWAIFRVFRAIGESIIASPIIADQSFDASLLRISFRILAFLLGSWLVIARAQDLGAELLPLLAGLGVGGLAVALAAQTTLANFIGSLIIFAVKPVRAGDFIRYGNEIGTVEQIGLHSTRIRSLERTVVTIPNAEFSEMKLDNFMLRDRRLLRTVLQLRYETTPDQLRYVLAKLRELMLAHPMVTEDPARVRFVGYGAYSKDVEIFVYLRCQDQNTFLAIQEDVLLRIEDIISEAGTGFAFPSQTAYLSRDRGIDSESGEHAAAQIKQWRGEGRLPFPEFAAEERGRLEDTLDYPPQGSPDHGKDPGPATAVPAGREGRSWPFGVRFKRGKEKTEGAAASADNDKSGR